MAFYRTRGFLLTAQPMNPLRSGFTRLLRRLMLAFWAVGCMTPLYANEIDVAPRTNLDTAGAGAAASIDAPLAQSVNPAAGGDVTSLAVGALSRRASKRYQSWYQRPDTTATTQFSVLWVPEALAQGRVSLGLHRYTPARLDGHWDPGWPGGAFAVDSEVEAITTALAASWKATPKLRLGVSLLRTDSELQLSRLQPETNQLVRFRGDDHALSWQAGLLWQLSPAMRVGLSYQAPYRLRYQGSLSESMTSTPAGANLTLPESLTWSVEQQLDTRWQSKGSLVWRRNSRYNDFSSDSPLVSSLSEYGRLSNEWSLSWGARYRMDEALGLGFGFLYERQSTSTVRLPEQNRYGVSLGGQWRPYPQGEVELAYLYRWAPAVELSDGLDGRFSGLRRQALQLIYSHRF